MKNYIVLQESTRDKIQAIMVRAAKEGFILHSFKYHYQPDTEFQGDSALYIAVMEREDDQQLP